MSKKPVPIHIEIFTGNYESVHVSSLDGESRYKAETLNRRFFAEIGYKPPTTPTTTGEQIVERVEKWQAAEKRAINLFSHLDKKPWNMAECFACWLIERHGFRPASSTVIYV